MSVVIPLAGIYSFPYDIKNYIHEVGWKLGAGEWVIIISQTYP